jgi:hypothetical protein
MIEVTHECKIDLLAVQEVRWLGRSIIEKDCKIYGSCDDILGQSLLLVNIPDQE